MGNDTDPKHMPNTFTFERDPYNFVIKTFCTKWKIYIIRGISIDGFTRFNKFKKQLPISENVLSNTLKQLENDGLIERTVYPEVPVRVEYRLTEMGKSVLPILDLMYDWGWKQMKKKGIDIDPLGEMWHGYREKKIDLMVNPFK